MTNKEKSIDEIVEEFAKRLKKWGLRDNDIETYDYVIENYTKTIQAEHQQREWVVESEPRCEQEVDKEYEAKIRAEERERILDICWRHCGTDASDNLEEAIKAEALTQPNNQ